MLHRISIGLSWFIYSRTSYLTRSGLMTWHVRSKALCLLFAATLVSTILVSPALYCFVYSWFWKVWRLEFLLRLVRRFGFVFQQICLYAYIAKHIAKFICFGAECFFFLFENAEYCIILYMYIYNIAHNLFCICRCPSFKAKASVSLKICSKWHGLFTPWDAWCSIIYSASLALILSLLIFVFGSERKRHLLCLSMKSIRLWGQFV